MSLLFFETVNKINVNKGSIDHDQNIPNKAVAEVKY